MNELEDTAYLAYQADSIRKLATNIVLDTIEIGQRLSEVRDRLSHNKKGGFEEWIKKEFEWSRRHAYRLMKIHEELGDTTVPTGHSRASVKALAALASAPEEIRQEILEQPKDTRLTEKEVKERVAAAEQKAKQERDQATSELTRVKAQWAEKSAYIAAIERNISDLVTENKLLRSGKDIPNFRTRLNTMNSSVSSLIQNDTLVKLLIELESVKEHLEFDHDLDGLRRLIIELESLSKRAQDWAERITPTNDRWLFQQEKQNDKT